MAGSVLPQPFSASGNEMTLLEVWDDSDTADGYTLSLSCICDGCEPGACTFAGVAQPTVCGEHGTCNAATGFCECLPGFGGLYCDTLCTTRQPARRVKTGCCRFST